MAVKLTKSGAVSVPSYKPSASDITKKSTPKGWTSGGGGGGGSSSSSSVNAAGLPKVEQSIIEKVSNLPLTSPTKISNIKTIQTAAASQQQGFSGKVEEFNVAGKVETPVQTKYFVKGEEVARLKAGQGKQIYEPRGSIATGKAKANITIGSGATRQEISISPAELREVQFQQGQQGAGQLLLGGEEVTGNIQLPSDVYSPYQRQLGTRQDIGLIQLPPEAVLRPPGTIYQVLQEVYEPVDTYGLKTGEQIPFYDTYTIGEDYGTRKATAEEIQTLSDYNKAIRLSDKEAPSNLQLLFEETKGKVQRWGSGEWYSESRVNELFSKGGKVGEVTGGFITGLVPARRGEFLSTAVIFGVSAGVGFGAKAVGYGLSALPGVAGKVAPVGWKGLQLTAGVVGTGIYAGKTIVDLQTAGSINEQSKIVGNVAREFGAGYFGYRAGSKGYDIYQGWRATRGRTFIDIPQGEYPTAELSKEVRMFKTNVYKEFGGKPGAFHTTSRTFWKEGIITPQQGTSELPGLYGSTKISTPFSKITGSGSRVKLFPSLSELTNVQGKPGVAFLQPEGFRYSPYIKTTPYLVNGQSFSYAFKNPAKTGYADIPLLKSEIEAIFRVDAGSYGLVSNKFYTTIKGVNVPVDVFKFDIGLTGSAVSNAGNVNLVGGTSSYSLSSLSSSSIAESGVVTFLKDYKTESYSYKTTEVYPTIKQSIISPSITSSVSNVFSYSSSRVTSYSGGSSVGVSSQSINSFIKSSVSPSLKQSTPLRQLSSSINSAVLGSSITTPSYYKQNVPAKRQAITTGFKQQKYPRQSFGRFPVYVRRFGQYKVRGFGRTPEEAVGIGKEIVSKTLGATFKVPAFKGIKVSGYRTKKEKGEYVFIEPSKRRLSTSSELREIFSYKRAKSRGKKR